MVNANVAFGHHHFCIPLAGIVGEAPAYAQRNHRSIEMPA